MSVAQLERWRQHLWLPRTTEWRGEDGAVRPEIVRIAALLAQLSGQGRRGISWLGWAIWALADTPQTAERLRGAVVSALRTPLDRAGLDVAQVPVGDSDDAFEARQQLAAQLLQNRRSSRLDLNSTLRESAAREGVELPPSWVPNLHHRAVTGFGARVLVGGTADIGFEEMLARGRRPRRREPGR
ncbi:hypothetical protein ABZ565_29160 [Streptomyces sp. NPDC016469]|uniref:hypothetical protein n=1 Tax=Streptomyces sp. NPDC016469 TaxID=3157191 RepID=UPI0033C89B52